MGKYLMVGIGGFLGAIARFSVGGFVSAKMGSRFPYGTFVINCTGSFLIGFIITLLAEKTHWSPSWRYLIPIGFIGAFTTFSTFEYETFRVFQDGEMLMAFLNVILSVIGNIDGYPDNQFGGTLRMSHGRSVSFCEC